MAELLIKASPHWMDSFTQVDIDKMTPDEKQSYEARSQKGDIIVVRPDGWEWGKLECPPDFVVVKLPGVKEEDVKQYEQPLMQMVTEKDPDGKDVQVAKMVKIRKHAIDSVTVDSCAVEVAGAKEIPQATFATKLITKTVSAVAEIG